MFYPIRVAMTKKNAQNAGTRSGTNVETHCADNADALLHPASRKYDERHRKASRAASVNSLLR